jgi:large-conductance mechanosensitive channel
MAESNQARDPKTDSTKVVTTGNTVRIETPKGNRRRRHEKVSVIVGPDEFVGGFVAFLREHAIVGLAIGFAIGTQAQTLVKTLVSSFIDPTFQLLFGKSLNTRTFTLHFHSHHADFGWGAFIYGLLDFIFVLAAIYAIVKLLNLDKLDKPQA